MANRPLTKSAGLLLIGALLLVGAVPLWIVLRPTDQREAPVDPPIESSPGPVTEEADVHPKQAGEEVVSDDARVESGKTKAPDETSRQVVSRQLTGHVASSLGRPLEGVELTWTPLSKEFAVSSWRSQDWEAIERVSQATTSGSDGRFSFDLDRVSEPTPSVIWATQPGRRASRILLLEEEGLQERLELQLEETPPIRVRVSNDREEPISAARVELRGLVPWRGESLRDEWDVRAQRVFFRNATTDETGACELAAMWERASILARKDGLISKAYSGPAVDEIDLVLGTSYRLSGNVVVENGGDVPAGTAVFVDVEEKRGLGTLAVRVDGSFGPCAFRRPPQGEGTCRLSGGGLLAPLVTFDIPVHGGEVRVSIEARVGASLAVEVRDARGPPVAAASVCAGFDEEPHWTEWFEADEEGRVDLSGLPAEGYVTLVAKSDDFEKRSFGPFSIPRDTDEPITLVLSQAGSVEVVVRHGEDPVEHFQLRYWDESPADIQFHNAKQAPGGRLLLESVRAGLVHMYAYNDEFAQSNTATVEVTANETVRAELFVTDPIVGTGRVVDGETFLPIEGASVQPFTSYGGLLHTPWSDPVPVDSNGYFRVKGFSPGNARMYVNAPGYEEDYVSTAQIPGQLLDFGSLPLFRSASFTVRLVAPDIADFTEYHLEVGGVRRFPNTAFDSDGVVTLEGCVPGTYFLGLTAPDGEYSQMDRVLQSGEEWEIEWPIPAGTRLTVELPESKADVFDETYVTAFHGGTARRFSMAKVSEGKAVFSALWGDTAVLELSGSTGDVVARQRVELAPPGPQLVSLSFDIAPLRVRVTDVAGDPIAGAELNCTCAGDTSNWETTVATDSDGIAIVESPPCDKLRAFVFHPTHGHHYGIPIERVGLGNTVEIVIDPAYSVRFRLKDGGDPVTGIKAVLFPVEGLRHLPARHPDSQGRLMWTDLGPGAYLLRAGAPGYWFTEARAEASRGGTRWQDVQLIRTGDLEIRLETPDGDPVTDRPVKIKPLEMAGRVADWIEEGRVSSSSAAGLLTDAEGRLVLQGLPRGSYQVSAQSSDGRTISHVAGVPPGGQERADLRLP